jgi:predicted DNA-binding antitoxin AbrB/MazE fold protein
MTLTVKAVYANGVLTPAEPLPLADGTAVDLTVAQTSTPEEEAVMRQLMAARTPAEYYAAMQAAKALDQPGTYDVVEEMDKWRRANGRAPLVLRPGDEGFY